LDIMLTAASPLSWRTVSTVSCACIRSTLPATAGGIEVYHEAAMAPIVQPRPDTIPAIARRSSEAHRRA
jgi:hypothetical protein